MDIWTLWNTVKKKIKIKSTKPKWQHSFWWGERDLPKLIAPYATEVQA